MTVRLTNPKKLSDYIITEDSEITIVYDLENGQNIYEAPNFIHENPNIKSRINIKAVLRNNSNIKILGKLVINKNAKGVDTYLKSDCLIIDANCSATIEPSLEIHESEVKAGHGAAIGYISPEFLNYLYSKGLDKNSAQLLIIESFKNS